LLTPCDISLGNITVSPSSMSVMANEEMKKWLGLKTRRWRIRVTRMNKLPNIVNTARRAIAPTWKCAKMVIKTKFQLCNLCRSFKMNSLALNFSNLNLAIVLTWRSKENHLKFIRYWKDKNWILKVKFQGLDGLAKQKIISLSKIDHIDFWFTFKSSYALWIIQ